MRGPSALQDPPCDAVEVMLLLGGGRACRRSGILTAGFETRARPSEVSGQGLEEQLPLASAEQS